MGDGTADGSGRATRRQQDDRLARCAEGTSGGDERPAVDHVLGVDRDRPGVVVVDTGRHQVDHRQVGLVAQRDEPRDTQPAVLQQGGEVEHQVAALAEHRHLRRPAARRGSAAAAVLVSTTPRQFGPTSTAPADRARRTTSCSARAPSAPSSESPAVITTRDRAPAPTASATVWTSSAAGTQTTTRSSGSPSWSRASASVRCVRRPSTSAPRRLTSSTGRSPLDSSARRLRMCPHLAGSSLAPTTVIEPGSKRASSGPPVAVAEPGPDCGRDRCRGPLTPHPGEPSITD